MTAAFLVARGGDASPSADLARALWRAGREKALARRLGEQAVEAYRKAGPAFEREHREAQAWLRRISAAAAVGSASGPGRRR
jgi:hypothetical protein